MLGEQLGLPHDVVWRHPFPGPGLAVRCLCGDADAAVMAAAMPLPSGVDGWVVPVRTVGVQGDERSYSELLAVEGFADLETAGAFRPAHHQRAPDHQPGRRGDLPPGRAGWRAKRCIRVR